MKKPTKAEIVHAIRTTWISLDSHLDTAVKEPAKKCEYCGDTKWDALCVKRYAQVIDVLSRML